MNAVLCVIAWLLALAMLGAGLFKLTQDRATLARKGMGWAEDFAPTTVKAIGAAEVLGAIGLVVPAAVGVVPILVPIAAACLAAAMLGAVVVHLRRRDGIEDAAPAAVLWVFAVLIAWGRFGPYPL